MVFSVICVVLFAMGAKAESCVSGDGNCFPEGDAMPVLMQAKRTAAKVKHVTSDVSMEMLASDYPQEPEPKWSYRPNVSCVGNWDSDSERYTLKPVHECKDSCEASTTCIGVVVGSNAGEERCVHCTSLELETKVGPSTYVKAKRGWSNVTCPVLGAMLKAGDLIPNEPDFVNKTQVLDAMLRVGFDATKARGSLNRSPGELINLRNGHVHNEAEYAGFEKAYLNGSRWSVADVETAIAAVYILYKKPAYNPNTFDYNQTQGGLDYIRLMLILFADSDGRLSKYEMKQLYLFSDYPIQFTAKRKLAVEEWDAAH